MASVIDNFPDISFIDNEQISDVLNGMITDYEARYKEITGEDAALSQADPIRLIINACALQIYQGMQYADFAGKMSFLKYSMGDYLDNLAALRGIERKPAAPATTVLSFGLSSVQTTPIAIPEGTRVTNGNQIYFATDKYAEIPAGQTSITVTATCTEPGIKGNGYAPGEFKTLVETRPYVTAVQNTTTTSGGTEIETDDALRDRIFESFGSYSTAGPESSYVYYVKQADASIVDVSVGSSVPGQVDICFSANKNQVPSQELMDKVENYLISTDVRPLTDHVVITAPQTETYNVAFTYYIAQSKAAAVDTIQADVTKAVNEYNDWQTAKLGRDINPSFLIQKIMETGVKRVEVTAPTAKALSPTTLAQLGTLTVSYGGIEND